MTFKINIFGIKSTAITLALRKKLIERNTQAGLKKAGFFVQGEVKLSIAGRRAEPTSVDTGKFLNSVDLIVTKAMATIFSNVPYAKHLEFGTSRISPRRHFNNSLARNKQNINKILRQAIKKF